MSVVDRLKAEVLGRGVSADEVIAARLYDLGTLMMGAATRLAQGDETAFQQTFDTLMQVQAIVSQVSVVTKDPAAAEALAQVSRTMQRLIDLRS